MLGADPGADVVLSDGAVSGRHLKIAPAADGAFAAAHGGTLFLDEIGDLPLEIQPKLLRLLKTGEVTPLETHLIERYDVRIVAATHRDLWEEVTSGSFRGDLYYRLARSSGPARKYLYRILDKHNMRPPRP